MKRGRSKSASVRERAVRALLLIGRGQNRNAQAVLNVGLTALPTLNSKDTSLFTELVYGVLRYEHRLAWLVDSFCAKPASIPPFARQAMSVAAYELTQLDRIPSHASVNWAVDLVRGRFGSAMGGVANAVLRKIAAQGSAARSPSFYLERIADTKIAFAVSHSLPLWLAKYFIATYGQEAARQYACAFLQTPWPCVRINPLHSEAADVYDHLQKQYGALPVGTFGLRLPPAAGLDARKYVQKGVVSFQGGGSQQVMAQLEKYFPPDQEIWDVCAGFGGKAAWLLERGYRVVLAGDPHFARMNLFRQEFARLGLPMPWLVCGRGETAYLRNAPQVVFVDAPCSGLGTLARRPDIKRVMTPGAMRDLEILQRKITANLWAMVPNGGRLIYCTCALNPRENEDIAYALSGKILFEYQSTPDEWGSDLLYAAVIEKR
jgi:16S rRNA (cytosine967-C5)-methyltransferase